MRILITGPSSKDIGGVLNYYETLIQNTKDETLKFIYVEVGRSSSTSPMWKRPLDYLLSIFRFRKAIIKNKPDLIQISPSLNWTSLPLNLVLLVTAKIFYRNPILVFFHGWRKDIGKLIQTNTIHGWLIRKILLEADYYAVLAGAFRMSLVAAGFDENRILVTSMMVDTSEYKVREFDNKASEKPFKVLFLSRIERDKGSRELIAAIRWILETQPYAKFQFIIAGCGSDEKYLRSELKPEIETGIVIMPGYLRGDEKIHAYEEADIYVFPSFHNEGFPNTILEAMAAGLPMIYTSVGALKDILAPENGICIQLEELSGINIGKAIWSLHQDEQARRNISKTNRNLVKEKFDTSVVSSQMIDFYSRIISDQVNKNNQ